jgi:hypothetical protein
MNCQPAVRDRTQLTPLPKSATAATRVSGLVSSPASSGTRRRIQSVAGPGRFEASRHEAMLDALVVKGRVVDQPRPPRRARRAALRSGRWIGVHDVGRQREIERADAQRRRAGNLDLPGMERRAHQLHLATGPEQPGLHRERRYRHRAEELDREPGEHHPLTAGNTFRAACEQRGRRAAVERLGRPRAAHQLGGKKTRAILLEEGAGHGEPVSVRRRPGSSGTRCSRSACASRSRR